jgi:hypothetical protein
LPRRNLQPERIGKPGEACCVTQGGGNDCSVEIRAEAHSVDPEMLDQMIGVPDDVLKRRVGQHAAVGTQEACGKIHAGQPARFPDSRQLIVG